MKRTAFTASLALAGAALIALTACAPRESSNGGKEAVDETKLVDALPAAPFRASGVRPARAGVPRAGS